MAWARANALGTARSTFSPLASHLCPIAVGKLTCRSVDRQVTRLRSTLRRGKQASQSIEPRSLERKGSDGKIAIMIDWSACPAVERSGDTLSGAWRFKNTRVPVKALFENLESGATVDQFLEWFPGVTKQQALAVLETAAED
jgi:uncharacterized protein (DUF433 family)